MYFFWKYCKTSINCLLHATDFCKDDNPSWCLVSQSLPSVHCNGRVGAVIPESAAVVIVFSVASPPCQCRVLIGCVRRLRKFLTDSRRFLFLYIKMSDKRRRRKQNSDESEHSESDETESKNGGDDLDLDKDEGVVSLEKYKSMTHRHHIVCS